MKVLRRVAWAACGLLLLGNAVSAQPSPSTVPVRVDINAPTIAKALIQFSEQVGLQLVFPSEDPAASLPAPRVVGTFTPEDALKQLLKGSGLKYEFVNDRTIAVTPRLDASSKLRISMANSDSSTVAPEDQPDSRAPINNNRQTKPELIGKLTETSAQQKQLQEIVVTGTQIRGGETTAPVIVFTQADFDAAGAATAQDFLATLTQNWGGGQTEATVAEPGHAPNPAYGTAVDLRGLGAGSTLVLVNGRRLAQGGSAEFTDVSMIPLSAVERIEVLTDGASAIYGSDAIGGVVNFIMRDDYSGAETRLRGGESTHGDAADYRAAQTLGTTWNSGGAIVNYEYYQRGSVSAQNRSFSSQTVIGPYDLLPSQKTNSVYASANQDVSDRVKLSADAIYADRNSNYVSYNSLALESDYEPSSTKQYGGAVGLSVILGKSWEAEFGTDANRNETDSSLISISNGTIQSLSSYDLWSADAKVSGDLIHLRSGDAKLAAGVSYRGESYKFSTSQIGGAVYTPTNQTESHVSAAFAEVQLPLIGPRTDRSGSSGLMLSIAGRFENYSTFGRTFDPKYGLKWAPVDSVVVHATFGRSFKAPNLYQLNPFNGEYFLFDFPDAQSPTGTTRSILLTGNNPDLHQETAKDWTVGASFAPIWASGFIANLSYYSIVYTGQILSPQILSFNDFLNNPIYAGLAARRTSIGNAQFNSLVSALLSGEEPIVGCSAPTDPTTGACTEPASNVNAIVDRRLVNLATTRTNGVDLSANEKLNSAVGEFDISFNATYIFKFDEQITVEAPVVDLSNTAENPVRLRTRGVAAWNKGKWEVATTLNYVGRYTDNVGIPSVGIASWTTVDLLLGYSTNHQSRDDWSNNLHVFISAANLFDANPPNFAHQIVGLGYDPTNASPIGRVISLNLTKSW